MHVPQMTDFVSCMIGHRAGLVPLDFYRDTAGPIGRTVTDVATTFGALPGYDPLDSLTESIALFNVSIPDNYTQFLIEDGLRVSFSISVHMQSSFNILQAFGWLHSISKAGYCLCLYSSASAVAASMHCRGSKPLNCPFSIA